MYKYIITQNGKIRYTPMHIRLKTINIENAKENLLIFKEVMDKHNLKFGLIYGTLLGAIRENNFILHDDDTDVYILDEERQKFLNTLPDLISKGFSVGRYEGDVISIIRNDECIDIYIFRKYLFKYRIYNQEIIKEKFLTETTEFNFLNTSFNIPKDYDKCLIYLYGRDWKIPIKGLHSGKYIISVRIKQMIAKKFPYLYKWIKRIVKEIIGYQS